MSNWTDKDFETYTQSDWELIKSVKELTDTNLGNPAVLEFANEIALAIFGMLCAAAQKGQRGRRRTWNGASRIYWHCLRVQQGQRERRLGGRIRKAD